MTAMAVNKRRFILVDADDSFDGTCFLGQTGAAIEAKFIINMQYLFAVGKMTHVNKKR